VVGSDEFRADLSRVRLIEEGSAVDLNGKHVVVTGGSGGIGATLAHAFAEQGARVLVAARSEDKLRGVSSRIVGEHIVADLTDSDDVDSFVDRCLDTLGHVDVFVNNAGIETSTSFATTPRDELRTVARLNFEATLLLTRDIVPHMLQRGSGHIVQISSVAGAIPFPGLAAYAGTKAGINNFTETLRREISGTGVGPTVVSPGPVETEMWERLESDDRPFAAVGLKRFRQLGFLPKLTAERIADATVDAVVQEKRFVRLPKRYSGYHLLSNAPRRLVEGALLGTKFPRDWSGAANTKNNEGDDR
jgi:short-subunit dehydrogenase